MSLPSATEKLAAAFGLAMKARPKKGGFPVFAEVLRREGLLFNYWYLPSCSALYKTSFGDLVQQMPPLITGLQEIPKFNQEAVIAAIRADQAGETEFPEFLASIWEAGVVSYDVDFERRCCTYYGINKTTEFYEELYPIVDLTDKFT